MRVARRRAVAARLLAAAVCAVVICLLPPMISRLGLSEGVEGLPGPSGALASRALSGLEADAAAATAAGARARLLAGCHPGPIHSILTGAFTFLLVCACSRHCTLPFKPRARAPPP